MHCAAIFFALCADSVSPSNAINGISHSNLETAPAIETAKPSTKLNSINLFQISQRDNLINKSSGAMHCAATFINYPLSIINSSQHSC